MDEGRRMGDISFFFEKDEKMKWIVENEYNLTSFLKRNGFTVVSSQPDESRLLVKFLPKMYYTFPIGVLPPEAQEMKFYQLMSSETNRNLFKRLCLRKSLTNQELSKAFNGTSNSERISKFIKDTTALSVITEAGDGLGCPECVEYGANFEWYVCQLLSCELRYIANWGGRVEGAPDGGDYDVLAYNGDKLVHVECKGKPPQNIGRDELVSFLKRDYYLRPYLSIFLVDTDANLDILIESFDGLIKDTLEKDEGVKTYFTKLSKGVVSLYDRLFVLNSTDNLVEKFKFCFRQRFRLGVEDMPIDGIFWAHKQVWNDSQDAL